MAHVQTYGVVAQAERDAGDFADTHEASALLGTHATPKVVHKRDGRASLASSVSNLLNTIMGTGILAFPMAMASSGVLLGMFTCAFCGLTGGFGLYLLTLCAQEGPHRSSSFASVAKMTFPRGTIFFNLAVAVKCFGVSISYLIIVKGLMPNVVNTFYHLYTGPDTNAPLWLVSGRNWITLFMVILVPLSFMPSIDSLRHASYVAVFSVVYLVIIVITCYFRPLDGMPERGPIKLIDVTPKFVSTFPVQVFAYTCAQNVFPIFNELKSNSQKRVNLVVGSSIGTAVMVYEIVAIFGYLTFGSTIGPNVIAMYPPRSLFVAVGQVAIVILVMLGYPLQLHPSRACFDKVYTEMRKMSSKVEPGEDAEDEEDDGHGSGHEIPALRHTIITTVLLVTTFSIAYFVSNLQIVLSFVGSTGSTTISFILPGLFYWKLKRSDANANRWLSFFAILLAIWGCMVLIFCLGFNIYEVIYPNNPL